jgi:hypothetical protein
LGVRVQGRGGKFEGDHTMGHMSSSLCNICCIGSRHQGQSRCGGDLIIYSIGRSQAMASNLREVADKVTDLLIEEGHRMDLIAKVACKTIVKWARFQDSKGPLSGGGR